MTEYTWKHLPYAIERIVSFRPMKITKVIGGTQPYGEEIPPDRYPVQIFIEIEIDLFVKQYNLGLWNLKKAIVQPNIINESSPVIFENTNDYQPKETTITIKRSISVYATLDAEKKGKNIYDDFKIIKIS